MSNEEIVKKARQDLLRSIGKSALDAFQTSSIIVGVSAGIAYYLKHYYHQDSQQ